MSADAPTAVDAVIVTYNSRDTIRACVTSLIGEERVDIVVVDGDSPEGGLTRSPACPSGRSRRGATADSGSGATSGRAPATRRTSCC